MVQVVNRPCRQQLPRRYAPKGRVRARAIQIGRAKVERAEITGVFAPQSPELLNQIREWCVRAIRRGRVMREWVEWALLTVLKNPPQPGHPVIAFGDNEMAHDFSSVPSALAVVAKNPVIAQSEQETAQDSWGAVQNLQSLREFMHSRGT